jgi:NitT/TauT family transport system permease protein
VTGAQRAAWTAAAATIVCASWWVLTALTDFPTAFVPSPSAVLRALVEMVALGFFEDIAASTARILAAFGLSALLAIPLGLLMGVRRRWDAFLQPIVDFGRYIPVPALLPLFVLWSGIGETPKFLILFTGTFFQLVVLVRDSTRAVPQVLYDSALTLGARKSRLLSGITLPYLAPALYDHLRVTLGWCWTYLVIAELVAVERGIGFVIKEAQRFGAADRLFVCFLTLGVIGLLTDTLVLHLRPKLFPFTKPAT